MERDSPPNGSSTETARKRPVAGVTKYALVSGIENNPHLSIEMIVEGLAGVVSWSVVNDVHQKLFGHALAAPDEDATDAHPAKKVCPSFR